MDIALTLDYELFLGSKTGSVDACLVDTLARIRRAAPGVRMTLFVDAVYLLKLRELLSRGGNERLRTDYDKISSHLKELVADGHEVQLHVHPHWQRSEYDGMAWHADNEHYKLCDLSEDEAMAVFADAKNILEEITGKRVTTFRAGGFSAQPTELLTRLFDATGIKADSSVYPGNFYDSKHQKYDYRTSCPKSVYRFGADICEEDAEGSYTEVPLTTYNLSPLFYWRLAALKILKLRRHRRLGDGLSVKTTGESIRERLLRGTQGFATIDEFKSSYLAKAYRKHKSSGAPVMCIIGHPKLATEYSVKKLAEFCRLVKSQGDRFVTISEIADRT